MKKPIKEIKGETKEEEEKVRTFSSEGMLWNDGDIPVCSYCGKDFDEVDELHETPFSGGLCCDDDACREELLLECLESEVVETTEDEM